MKKSTIILISFFMILCIALSICSFTIVQNKKNIKVNKYNNQVTDVHIINSSEVLVKQTVDVRNCIPEKKFKEEIFEFYIPFFDINKNDIYSSYIKDIECNIGIFKTSLDKNLIVRDGNIVIYNYQHDKLIEELEENNYKVTFNYCINLIKIVSYDEKKDDYVLHLRGNNKFKKENELYIHLPNDNIILNNNKYIERNDNIYKINLKRKYLDYEIRIDGKLDTEPLKSYKEIKSNYYILNRMLKFQIIVTVLFVAILTIAYIQKRVHLDKGIYKRDTIGVINPILAESIVDGRIDVKNLIMTGIIDLINKKKIENIDNDSIKLIDASNLTDIEEEILCIVFATSEPIETFKGKTAKLSDLNLVFKNGSKKVVKIYERIKKIKKLIKTKLYDMEIINKIWEVILRQIKAISGVIALNSFMLLCVKQEKFFTLFAIVLFLDLLVYLGLFESELIKDMLKHKPIIKEEGSGYIIIALLYLFFSSTNLIFNLRDVDIEIIIAICSIIIINIIIINLSNIYVLTKKGKEEFKKAYMLKKYLVDYSLIEGRDIDGLVIYDDYLTYATAYGIPNKITNRFKENLLNLNIRIQIALKILDI